MALQGLPVRERSDTPAHVAAAADEKYDLDMDAVLGELTHAVVNALNTISAASELSKLLIAREDSAGIAEPLARIESECMRAARLLRDGRAFMTFRVRSAQNNDVDLVALMKTCADSFEGSVVINDVGTLPLMSGDPGALRRAFMEILGNAFQFGASQVRVVMELMASGRGLRIAFHDNGPGIQASAVRIFEPFFSMLPDEHSGLGLALAERILRAHGGGIAVDAGSSGATFRIELPQQA